MKLQMSDRTVALWRHIHANPGCGTRDIPPGVSSSIYNGLATLIEGGKVRAERVPGANCKAYYSLEAPPPGVDEPPPAPPAPVPNSVFQLGDFARGDEAPAPAAPAPAPAALAAVETAAPAQAKKPDLIIPTLVALEVKAPAPPPAPLPMFSLTSANELTLRTDLQAPEIRLDANTTRALFRWLDRLHGTRLQELVQEAS